MTDQNQPQEVQQVQKFTFYWLSGKREVLPGTDPVNALTLGGYGGEALYALEFYVKDESDDFFWDPDKKGWTPRDPIRMTIPWPSWLPGSPS